jgi:hypothetical protein
MIGINSNFGKFLVVSAEQRVGGQPFAFRELGKQFLRPNDNVVEECDIRSNCQTQSNYKARLLTFIAVVGFRELGIILSGVGLRRATWWRHLEEGIRRDHRINSCQIRRIVKKR